MRCSLPLKPPVINLYRYEGLEVEQRQASRESKKEKMKEMMMANSRLEAPHSRLALHLGSQCSAFMFQQRP